MRVPDEMLPTTVPDDMMPTTRRAPARPVCGGRKRNGDGLCTQRAGWGTSHVGFGRCKLHGGASPNGEKAGALEAAASEAQTLGLALDVEPHEALMWCVRIAAGEVAYFTRKIAELDVRDQVGPVVTMREHQSVTDRGDVHDLYDETRAGAELHIWIKARHGAVERLARFSKLALDAGVEERQVRAVERYGDQIAQVLQGFMHDLGLTADQARRAPGLLRRHLELVESTATDLPVSPAGPIHELRAERPREEQSYGR